MPNHRFSAVVGFMGALLLMLSLSSPAQVNLPPTIAQLADQSVAPGSVVTVSVFASDPNGDAVRLSLITAPAFVSLADNGNGTGTIRIAPAAADTVGGRVTVQAADRAGLTAQASFNVTIAATLTVPGLIDDLTGDIASFGL